MSDVRIRVSIDGEQADLTLGQITQRVEELKDQASGLDEGTEELRRLTEQIEALQAAAQQLSLSVTVDSEQATEAISGVRDAVEALPDVSLEVTADAAQASQALQDVAAEAPPVEIQVTADPAQAQEAISEVTGGAVTVPVEADVAPAQAEISSLQSDGVTVPVDADTSEARSSIEGLSAEDPVVVPVEVDAAAAAEAVGTALEDIPPVELPVDTASAQASISQLREQLKAAKDEIASSDVGSQAFIDATQRAGELKDRIADISEAIEQQKGEPIERLGSQFRGLGDSIASLDFKKAGDQFKTFSQTIGQVDLKGLSSGAGTLAKTIGGGVVDAFKTLGRVILANPILLIAGIVIAIGTALFKLKDSIKPVQVAFDAIGDAIGFVIDLFKEFSDFIGLSSFAETEAIEKANKAYEEKSKVIEETTKRNIAALKAEGATQAEIAEETVKGAEATVDALNDVVAAEAARLASLQERRDEGRELSDEDQEFFDKAMEHLGAQKDAVIALTQAERDLGNARRDAANAELAAADQLAVLQAKSGKDRVAAQKKAIEDAANVAAETARLAGKSQAEIDLILEKGRADRRKLDEDFNKQAAARVKARQDARAQAAENEVERLRLAKATEEEITAARIKAVQERAKVEAANAGSGPERDEARLKAAKEIAEIEQEAAQNAAKKAANRDLEAAQAEQKRLESVKRSGEETETIDQQVFDNRIALIEAAAQVELASVESTSEEAAKIRKDAEADVTAERVRFAQETAEKEIDAILEQRKRLVGGIEGGDISFDDGLSGLSAGFERQRAALKKELDAGGIDFKEYTDKIRDLADEQKGIFDSLRQDVVSDAQASGQGLFGLAASTDKLEATLKAQEEAILKARSEDLANAKKYDDQLTEVQREGAEQRAQLASEAVTQTAEQAQQVVSIVGDLASAQIEIEQQRIDTERTNLQAQYDARKEFIKANIQDETARDNALRQLDKDFASSTLALDRKALELKKKQIRQDRNVAIAQIILSTAIGIAGAVKSASSTGNPIAFAIVLAASLAAVAVTIAKANAALKQADASIGALGAGGGGEAPPSVDATSVGAGIAPASAAASATPQFTPAGVNPATGQGGGGGAPTPPIVVNSTVSVVDINSAQSRVRVSETGATIGASGG